MNYLDYKRILENESLPAVVVDLDAFDRNVQKLKGFGLRSRKMIRIATKSIRVPALIQRVLQFGSPFEGLMCFSAREAEFLATQLQMDDFLIAYPTLRDADLASLRNLHVRGKRTTLMVDSIEGLDALQSAVKGVQNPFPVTLEVDVSDRVFNGKLHIGARRSPIRSINQLLAMIEKINGYDDLIFHGLMAYESQVAGVGDRNPFKKFLNPILHLLRRHSKKAIAKKRKAIREVLREKKIPLALFNGGGTGSLSFSVQEEALTEVTAGSALLNSHLFDYYSNISFEPACHFALQVVRSSDRGFVTCQGGGYIASGEPGWDRLPVPAMPGGLAFVSMEGAGEVQTPLRVPADLQKQLHLGDPVLFRHAKAGELAERFNEYLGVSNGKIVERFPTYRGCGLSFF